MAPKHTLFIVAFLLSLGLDQGTKIWARAELKPKVPSVVTVVPGYFDLEYAENTAAAFSFLRGRPEARWLLTAFGVIALGVIGMFLQKAPPEARRMAFMLGLLAGGAIGNLLDRAYFGYVTDFILWKVGNHRWPNFNIADAVLLVGVGGLLLEKPKPKTAPAGAKS